MVGLFLALILSGFETIGEAVVLSPRPPAGPTAVQLLAGSLWIGAADGGVFRYDLAGAGVREGVLPGAVAVEAFVESPAGTVVALGRNVLYRCAGGSCTPSVRFDRPVRRGHVHGLGSELLVLDDEGQVFLYRDGESSEVKLRWSSGDGTSLASKAGSSDGVSAAIVATTEEGVLAVTAGSSSLVFIGTDGTARALALRDGGIGEPIPPVQGLPDLSSARRTVRSRWGARRGSRLFLDRVVEYVGREPDGQEFIVPFAFVDEIDLETGNVLRREWAGRGGFVGIRPGDGALAFYRSQRVSPQVWFGKPAAASGR